MTFGESIRSVLSNYAVISGRAVRSEFWWFWLGCAIVNIVLSILAGDPSQFGIFDILSSLFALAILLPSICVAGRRLHDIDKSAWWILLGIIPVIGWIILVVWYARPGTEGPNRFGPDPMPASVNEAA